MKWSTSMLRAAGLLMIAASAGAQSLPSTMPGSWMSSWPSGPPATGFTPSAWYDGRTVGFNLGAALALDFGRHDDDADADPVRNMLELGGGRVRPLEADGAAGTMSARLVRSYGTYGVWLGSSAFESGADGHTLPLLGIGAWAQRGQLTLSTQAVQLLGTLRVTQRTVTILPSTTPRDTGKAAVGDPRHIGVVDREDFRRLTGAETSIGWTRSRLTLQSRVGVGVGGRQKPARWGELWAGYWARPSVAVFACARGSAHVPAALEAVRGSQTIVGVQLVPGRETLSKIRSRLIDDRKILIERSDGDHRVLRLRVAATTLDVSSDAIGWTPVPARRVGSDRWEADLDLSPGVHRVAIRIDGGAWMAPPGLPVAADDFSGEVGLLVVP